MATDTLLRFLTDADLNVIHQDIGPGETLNFHTDSGANARWTCLVSTVGAGSVSAIEGLWYVGGFYAETSRRNVTTLKAASQITVTATADGFSLSSSSTAAVIHVAIVMLINTCSSVWTTIS